jgi:hypothetical protein
MQRRGGDGDLGIGAGHTAQDRSTFSRCPKGHTGREYGKESEMVYDPKPMGDPEPDSTDILGREEGGTLYDPKPMGDPEPGSTDILGREEGGTDVIGPEEGGTDILGREEGGTDILGTGHD